MSHKEEHKHQHNQKDTTMFDMDYVRSRIETKLKYIKEGITAYYESVLFKHRFGYTRTYSID